MILLIAYFRSSILCDLMNHFKLFWKFKNPAGAPSQVGIFMWKSERPRGGWSAGAGRPQPFPYIVETMTMPVGGQNRVRY
jgi:hypothetical protein